MEDNYLGIDEVSESMELYNSKPRRVCTMFLYYIFFVMVVALIISCFVGIEQYEKVQGKINNTSDEVVVINSEIGIIEQLNVKNGQEVLKGETLYKLKNDEENSLDYYTKKIDDINQKKAMIEGYLMYIEGKIVNLDGYLSNKYYNEYNAAKTIFDNQVTNLQEVDKQSFIQTEIKQTYADKQALEDEYNEIENTIKVAENSKKKLEVITPTTGKVRLDKAVFEGNVLNVGQEVASIEVEKQNQYTIMAYVSENEVVNMKKGMNIKFHMNAYPVKEYGHIDGKIVSISNKPIVNEVDSMNYYLIEIEITDLNEFKDNNKIDIKSGMTGTVNVITGKKKFIRIILEYFGVFGK